MTTVLVADDDASVRMAVRARLEADGYTVLEARDGQEALEVIGARKPDVALLDVRMPNLDGYGVLRALQRRADWSGRVLMLTGAVEEEDYMRGWQLGAHGYVAKPFEPDDLVSSIEEVVRMTPEELAERREREIERARLLRQLDRFLDCRPD